jgi:two-component system sensor histidine kinase UhpB
MGELLTLARQLRPTALDDHGLKAALAAHVDVVGEQTGIETGLESEGAFIDLPEDVQLVVYRVAQEALSNAAQHSGATRITVRLVRTDEGVELIVADDGRGFTFEEAGGGLGLTGMRERALLVGGEVSIESRPELGTRVSLRI